MQRNPTCRRYIHQLLAKKDRKQLQNDLYLIFEWNGCLKIYLSLKKKKISFPKVK